MTDLDKNQRIDLVFFFLSKVEVGFNEKNIFVVKRFVQNPFLSEKYIISPSIDNKKFSLENILVVFEAFCKKNVEYEEVFDKTLNE